MYNSLIFLLLLYIQIYLPKIKATFTIQGDFIYNIISQNISSNAFITLPFCTGTSSFNNQCFNLIFDMNGKYTMIINKSIDFLNGYNSSLSDKYSQIPNTLFVHNIDNIGTLESFFIKDSIYIKEINTSIDILSMLELNEMNFTYPQKYHSGWIGFNCRNEMGDNFLYLKKLLSNHLIASMNYYYQFTSLTKVNFTIGIEDDDPIINSFTFCEIPNTISYRSFPRRCIFNSLSNAVSGKIIRELTPEINEVTLNTIENGIYAPGKIGVFMLKEYEKASNNHCKIVKDNQIKYLKCDNNFNYEKLPVFMLEDNNGLKIKFYPVDIFNYTSGESYFKVKEGPLNWIIDLNILKHYDVFVSSSCEKIGLKENNIFLHTNDFMLKYYKNSNKFYIKIIIKNTLMSLLSGIILLLLTALLIKD